MTGNINSGMSLLTHSLDTHTWPEIQGTDRVNVETKEELLRDRSTVDGVREHGEDVSLLSVGRRPRGRGPGRLTHWAGDSRRRGELREVEPGNDVGGCCGDVAPTPPSQSRRVV